VAVCQEVGLPYAEAGAIETNQLIIARLKRVARSAV
jgi:hypothetical protein